MAGLGDTQGEREKTLKEQENRTEKVHVQLPVAASATEWESWLPPCAPGSISVEELKLLSTVLGYLSAVCIQLNSKWLE